MGVVETQIEILMQDKVPASQTPQMEEKIITPLWFYFHGLQNAIREDQVKGVENESELL